MDAEKYASMETVAVKEWLQVAGVTPAVGEENAVVAADVTVAAVAMAFRCGQNIQIAKCYSKSKMLVEMYKI